MKNEIVISGGTVEGFYNDLIIGDTVFGAIIDKGTFV